MHPPNATITHTHVLETWWFSIGQSYGLVSLMEAYSGGPMFLYRRIVALSSPPLVHSHFSSRPEHGHLTGITNLCFWPIGYPQDTHMPTGLLGVVDSKTKENCFPLGCQSMIQKMLPSGSLPCAHRCLSDVPKEEMGVLGCALVNHVSARRKKKYWESCQPAPTRAG